MQSTKLDAALTARIREMIAENYDLGQVTSLTQITGGYCNKSYGVVLAKDGASRKFLLRGYNPNIAEKEIRFEHALIRHLRGKGFDLAADVIDCRHGGSFVHQPDGTGEAGGAKFWALFEFLEGEDKYSWIKTDMTDSEFVSTADILARLHLAGRDFVTPPGAERVQPKIMDFLPSFATGLCTYALGAGDRRSDRLFKERLAEILAVIAEGCASAGQFRGMVELPIHCDYHPGNLKYRDGKGVGLFDFDWSKIDYRLFDVALALVYFCGVWEGVAAGSLELERMHRFLGAYDQACIRSGELSPLTEQELAGLPSMLAVANLFVLNWDLVDFYETQDPDDNEYYRYIHHNIGLLTWIEAHRADIQSAILPSRPVAA